MLDAFKDNLTTECQHECWNDEGAWGHLSPSCDFFEPLPPPPTPTPIKVDASHGALPHLKLKSSPTENLTLQLTN